MSLAILDGRTDEQREADDWAVMQHWRHWTIAWTTEDREIRQAAQWQWELAQRWMWGHFAPTEQHARRLALSHLDFNYRFLRRLPDEQAYEMAVAVLSGWEAAHGGA